MGEENNATLMFGVQLGESYIPLYEMGDISEVSFLDEKEIRQLNRKFSKEETTFTFELKDKAIPVLKIKFSDGSEAEYSKVIRCKNCEHYIYRDYAEPCCVCGYDGYKREPYDFCNDAKQRERILNEIH